MRKLLLMQAMFLLAAAHTQSQTTTPFDSTFVTPGFFLTQSTHGSAMVTVAAKQPDGKMVVTGNFTQYNGQSSTNLIRVNTDGSLDSSFSPAAGTDGDIGMISVQPDGKILVSGAITRFGNTTLSRKLFRLNTDGTYDSSFMAPSSFQVSYASAFVAKARTDGQILVGGSGVKTGDFSTFEMIRMNGDGSVDNSFNCNTAVNSSQFIYSIGELPNGASMVGGSFTSFAGFNQGALIRLNSDGSVDTTFKLTGHGFWNLSNYLPCYVTSICILPDESMLVGGSFKYYDDYYSPNLVHLHADGSIDSSFSMWNAPQVSFTQVAQVDTSGGSILIGGTGYVNGQPVLVVKLNPDGSPSSSFNPFPLGAGNSTINSISAFSPLPDGSVLVAGPFNFNVNAANYSGIAHLLPDGSVDAGWNAHFSNTGMIFKTYATMGGKILVGGSFNMYGGNYCNNLVRLLPNGQFDSTFQTGIGPDDLVTDIRELSDSTILISGNFTTVNNHPANGVAKLSYNGAYDSSFSIGTGPGYSYVYCILPLPGGNIMVGGSFPKFNGYASQGLVRLFPSGAVDSSFASPANAPWYSIGSMAALSNGELIVGDNSYKTNTDYTLPLRIWKVQQNGAPDAGFTTSSPGGYSATTKLSVTGKDSIYWTGQVLSQVSGSSTYSVSEPLLKVNPAGDMNNSGSQLPAGFSVNDFALAGDSAIFVCGSNLQWNDSANYVLKLKSDLSLDTGFNPVAVYYNLSNINSLRDGRIIIAGQPVRFFRLSAQPIPNMAILSGSSLQAKTGNSVVHNLFDSVKVESSSVQGNTISVNIVNEGSTPSAFGTASNSVVLVDGTNASDFTVDVSNMPTSLGKHDSAAITVTFKPSSTGIRTARVTIPYDNGLKQKYVFYLKGVTTIGRSNQAATDSSIIIYPNPSHGQFNILTSMQNSDVRVYESSGKLVYHRENQQSGSFSVNLSNRPKGVYMLVLRNSSKKIVRELVIQ